MNRILDDLKQELANKYIHDQREKEIFLTKATQYKMWANYIAGLILTDENYKEFHITDIRRVLKRLLGDLYNGPGAKESALLTADMADTSNWHFRYPCLKKVEEKKRLLHIHWVSSFPRLEHGRLKLHLLACQKDSKNKLTNRR
jgi:hypothetical protein